MKRNRNICLQVACMFFFINIFSCNYVSKRESNIKGTVTTKDTIVYKEYFSNGKIKAEISLNKDSIKNGVTKTYFDNGQLFKVVHYENGIKEGEERTYFYKNGKLNQIGKYKTNKKDSTWVTYYENGKTNSIENWINGRTFGEQFLFYPNGKLEQFSFSNFDGNTVYRRNYSKNSTIESEEGFPVAVVYNRNHLHVGDSLEVTLFLGLLDTWNIDAMFTDVTNNNSFLIKKIEGKKQFHYNERHNTKIFTYKIPCRKKGIYKLKVDIDIFDSLYKRSLKHRGALTYYVE